MKEHGHENHGSEPYRNQKSRGNGYAVKESVNGQSQQDGSSCVVMTDLLVMRLFPKMKMRRDGVLEQMHEKIAEQYKHQGLLACQMNRLWNHIKERHGQHVAGPQRQKILQKVPRPIPPHNKIPANQIPRRRDEP